MMDCRVVARAGLQVVTIGPTGRATHRLFPLLRPAPEAFNDRQHPRPLRQRQMLPDHPGDAMA